MTTKRTPAHKRVARAEKGKDEWKSKAIERREEAEKWKATAKRKSTRIEELEEQKAERERELAAEKQGIEQLKEELKKKASRFW